MHQSQASRISFAVMLILIGVWGFEQAAFVAIWAPGIQAAEFRPAMVFACSAVSILGGLGILWSRYVNWASRLLLAFLLIWLLWCKGFALVRAPAAVASWESLAETLVILSAVWTLAVHSDHETAGSTLRYPGARAACLLYGVALIAFGCAHLAYPIMTASLVPRWIPWHLACVYLTAATYFAAGAALLFGQLAELAARLSAMQMALFGALVWLPRLGSGARDPATINETAITFVLATSGWVISAALAVQAQRFLGNSTFHRHEINGEVGRGPSF